MLFSRRSNEDDHVTTSLLKRGVYRISDVEDEEIKRFNNSGPVYSFWGAVKYTFILTLLLWWLPIFGQMIAGFVGGRRAGTPLKAVIAAFIPILIIFTVMTLFNQGILPSEINGVTINPEQVFSNFGTGVPFIEPYLVFASQYVQAFMGAIQAVNLFRVDNYIVVLAFAYIGGVLSQQTRRELEYVAEHGGHETNIMIGKDQDPDHAPLRRRALKYSKNQPEAEMNFEDMQAVDGDADLDSVAEEQPIHTTKRRVAAESAEPHNRKAMEERVKSMEREQKRVEKKVRGNSTVAANLVSRSSKGTAHPKASRNEGEKDGNGYEYI